MKKSKNNIKITEMEKVVQQSEIIAGLTHVYTIYTDSFGNDEYMKNALECLSNQACEHRDYCRLLDKKISNEKDKKFLQNND